ncbi:MAG: cell division protein FtsQ/DivIB [Acidimicrobiia bacterium]|nr:FtsQ-type POTRA domain-containing protein [Acidobacteriota bacterium]MCZ6738388.1 FtsQ-type POTRA domain-containing protein [Actinomycetota bacterium]
MTMDPRLLERRQAVAEDSARRNVGLLLKFLVTVIMAGILVWLAFSPWLSVSQVRTAGIVTSNANEILAANRVVAGRPMIMLRPEAVERALELDPWIRRARVHLEWPDEVIVRVDERVPVAWFQTAGGWARRDIEGLAVPGPNSPDDTMPWIRLPALDDVDAESSVFVLGAAEFVASLPDSKHFGITMRVEGGEMWAVVDGYQVRLGRPVEMGAKALSLIVLLREPLAENSILVLIAPTHPAVKLPGTPPVSLEEVDENRDGEVEQSGSDDSNSDTTEP